MKAVSEIFSTYNNPSGWYYTVGQRRIGFSLPNGHESRDKCQSNGFKAPYLLAFLVDLPQEINSYLKTEIID